MYSEYIYFNFLLTGEDPHDKQVWDVSGEEFSKARPVNATLLAYETNNKITH